MIIYAEPLSFHLKTLFLILTGAILGVSVLPVFANGFFYGLLLVLLVVVGGKAYVEDYRKSYFALVLLLGIVTGSLAQYNSEKASTVEITLPSPLINSEKGIGSGN